MTILGPLAAAAAAAATGSCAGMLIRRAQPNVVDGQTVYPRKITGFNQSGKECVSLSESLDAYKVFEPSAGRPPC